MTEVTLDFLAAQLVRVLDGQRGIREELAELRIGQRSLEAQMAGLRRDMALSSESAAHEAVRIDGLVARIERIERRLELVE